MCPDPAVSRRGRSAEVDRLRSVYAGYGHDPAVARRWSDRNRGNRAMSKERAGRALALLERFGPGPLDEQRVLDLGCGGGTGIVELVGPSRSTGTAVGLDLSEERLRLAVERLPLVPFVRAEGSALPFRSGHFDVVVTFTVFSSILDADLAKWVADEVGRVLRSGGAVLWYDLRHPNPWNRHTRSLRRSAVAALFPGFTAHLEPITLFPPVARRLGPLTGGAYARLARARPLNSHYLGVIRKPH